jgi:hypothetical protein
VVEEAQAVRALSRSSIDVAAITSASLPYLLPSVPCVLPLTRARQAARSLHESRRLLAAADPGRTAFAAAIVEMHAGPRAPRATRRRASSDAAPSAAAFCAACAAMHAARQLG